MPKNRFAHFIFLICLEFLITFFRFISPTRAATIDTTDDTTVTATVPSQSTTGDTTAPSVPILVSPSDGSHSNTKTPTFVWRLSTDSGSNNIIYTLYLDGVATYLGVSGTGNTTGTGYGSRVQDGQIYLTPTIGLTEGPHTWQVTATDPSGNTSYSTLWSLTIDTTPPFIEVTQIDTILNPDIADSPTFDIAGPLEVKIIIHTEAYSDIELVIVNQSTLTSTHIYGYVASSGYITVQPYLDPGLYSITVIAIDSSALSNVSPIFYLNITQNQIIIPIPSIPPIITSPGTTFPGIKLPDQILIPAPPPLKSLPATVARLSTRYSLAIPIIISLAIGIIYLIIIIWKKRLNLRLVTQTGQPINIATVYHSRPPQKKARPAPISYDLTRDDGRLYIPGLARYSTLTIRTPDLTLVLSISKTMRAYTITI